MDTPAGPVLGSAEKELKAATLELTHIKHNITLLWESIAEMADLASLDSVTILPIVPVPVAAAVGSGAAEETVLAKIRPLKVPTDVPRFLPGTVPCLFLDDLQSKVSSFIGQDALDEDCEHYLLYLTNVPHIRTSVKDSLAAMTWDPALSHWEWCEALFLLHALSEHEHMMELNNLLGMGLLPSETYQQFAICVAHNTHIYGVKDDNEIVLASLSNLLPSETLNLILFSHHISRGDIDAKISSIITLTEYMKHLVGPCPPTRLGVPSSAGPEWSCQHNAARFDPHHHHNNGSLVCPDHHVELSLPSVDKPYSCAQCGPNSSHTTAQCKCCTNCHKVGPSHAQCRLPAVIT
ncbi:hypothetical protein CPC16_001941 [Podila verticillata]|nr:hypothetical protein CPC16_001941 [Podila verticillata]